MVAFRESLCANCVIRVSSPYRRREENYVLTVLCRSVLRSDVNEVQTYCVCNMKARQKELAAACERQTEES